MPAYYPAFIDVRARRCFVIGGGKIGEEKVSKLLDCGAKVVVISPEVSAGVRELADGERVEWVRRPYRFGDLEGAFIAIAATDNPKVNRQIYDEAQQRNVLLNVVDVTSLCTFIAPSVVTRGEVTIATSTGGASPALARKFRQELARSPILDYADLAPILRKARGELRRRGQAVSADHWQASITDDVMGHVRRGAQDEAMGSLMANLMVGTECDCPQGTCKKWDQETLTSGLAVRRATAPSG